MRTRFSTDLDAQLKSSLALNSKLFYLLKLIQSDFNGLNGLKLSGELLAVKASNLSETVLSVTAWFKSEVSSERPVYFDVDSEEFSESFGSENISHYETFHETLVQEQKLNIPNSLLFLSELELKHKLIQLFKDWVDDSKKLKIASELKSTELLLDEAKKSLNLLEK